MEGVELPNKIAGRDMNWDTDEGRRWAECPLTMHLLWFSLDLWKWCFPSCPNYPHPFRKSCCFVPVFLVCDFRRGSELWSLSCAKITSVPPLQIHIWLHTASDCIEKCFSGLGTLASLETECIWSNGSVSILFNTSDMAVQYEQWIYFNYCYKISFEQNFPVSTAKWILGEVCWFCLWQRI